MIQIHDVALCGPLVMSHFKKGVFTNNTLTTADYQREITQGNLFLQQFEGGILFLRRRPTHYIGNFHLLPGAQIHLEEVDRPVVIEISSRSQPKIEPWLNVGFSPILHRKRLTATEGTPALCPIRLAKAEEVEEVLALLNQEFDPITGCIPTLPQLREEIALGNIFVWEENGHIIALAHRSMAKNSSEIRHLAVDARHRGQGLSHQLMGGYFAHTQGERHLVWTANPIATHLYQSHGYTADGYTSTVLIWKGTTP